MLSEKEYLKRGKIEEKLRNLPFGILLKVHRVMMNQFESGIMSEYSWDFNQLLQDVLEYRELILNER